MRLYWCSYPFTRPICNSTISRCIKTLQYKWCTATDLINIGHLYAHHSICHVCWEEGKSHSKTTGCRIIEVQRTDLLLRRGFRSVEEGYGDWPGEDSGPPTQLQKDKTILVHFHVVSRLKTFSIAKNKKSKTDNLNVSLLRHTEVNWN